jgi:cupin fold WbuC family metalloprotein
MRGVQLLSEALFTDALERARSSPRRRMNANLHTGPEDNPHRFLNVFLRGTYVTPHRHEDPPKSETFLVLRGRVAAFVFDDAGAIARVEHLGDPQQRALPCAIDLAPGLWHSIVATSDEALCFEVKPGPWDPATDKEFARWAPREGEDGWRAYLAGLEARARDGM